MLLTAEDLESLEATLVLLADPQARRAHRCGEADFVSGDVLDEEQVRALIDERHRTPPE